MGLERERMGMEKWRIGVEVQVAERDKKLDMFMEQQRNQMESQRAAQEMSMDMAFKRWEALLGVNVDLKKAQIMADSKPKGPTQ